MSTNTRGSYLTCGFREFTAECLSAYTRHGWPIWCLILHRSQHLLTSVIIYITQIRNNVMTTFIILCHSLFCCLNSFVTVMQCLFLIKTSINFFRNLRSSVGFDHILCSHLLFTTLSLLSTLLSEFSPCETSPCHLCARPLFQLMRTRIKCSLAE